MGALQLVEQSDVVNGNGGLSGQGLQKLQPLPVGFDGRAVTDLQYTLDLPLGDEGYRVISDEAFVCQKRGLK